MNNIPQNISRRAALLQTGAAGVGAAALLLAAKSGQAQPATANANTAMDADKPAMAMEPTTKMAAPAGDLDIVKFALQMEQLEAAFYAQVVAAHQNQAYLTAHQFELTQQIAQAEAAHVQALEAVLTGAGGTVPDAPNFQFPASVFLSPITYAWLGYTLEEIGIGAYLGAVGSIQSDDIRKAAASIYGTEAQHAAILRSFAGFDFAPRYYESPLSVDQVKPLIAPYSP